VSGFPAFAEFFRAVHGRDPFPWQERLAEVVVSEGWPAAIGIPTGLGKTATIDVAVWSMASEAMLPYDQRTMPRRVWYVVDRRLLVDVASEHASRLADLLANGASPVLQRVRNALRELRGLGRDRPPLFVSRLRGGVGRLWGVPDPAQPAVICATVPMFGSRLLFRGYGVSRGMRPIEAAMAGTDALVLLDEAHLSPALVCLVERAGLCDANRTGVLRLPGWSQAAESGDLLPPPRQRARLVTLTATGRGPQGFQLTAADLTHPVVRRRLGADKPTRLVETTKNKLVSTLAAELRYELEQSPQAAACVFVNSPATARALFDALRTHAAQAADGFELVVLTGQLRGPDADVIRTRLLDPGRGAPAGAQVARDRPLVVVATQTLEVGADLDFDIVVSETAGRRAIVQRWGRLNRLGERADARGVLVHPVDAKHFGIYGEEPIDLWKHLCEQAGAPLRLDLGPGVIADVVGAPRDQPTRIPELLPHHLWEFAKTSRPPSDHAPPEVFFAGVEAELNVAVAWRAVLPTEGGTVDPPMSQREFVEVPIAEAREALSTRQFRRISPEGSAEAPAPDGLRPGDRIVVRAADGGYRADTGWDPESRHPVQDLAPLERNTVFLVHDALENLLGEALRDEWASLLARAEPDPELGVDPEGDAELADDAAAVIVQAVPELSGLSDPVIDRVGEDAVPVLRWRRPGTGAEPFIDALDELSATPRCSLDDHLASVAEAAEILGRAVGLPAPIVATLRSAGRFHDLGKADPRFQRWLGASEDGVLLAKSGLGRFRWRQAQTASGWPHGARHELLSVQLLEAALDGDLELTDPDLVLHLVLSHHGHGRPACPTSDGDGAMMTSVRIDATAFAAATDPSLPDWKQPERFRRLNERFGYWGLALLEAVVRRADHLVSAATPDGEVEVT
jgi:CRISPR-associated endonuclease/helicase Cas3